MYSAEISRTNPTMILFLLDQSGSMGEEFQMAPSYSSPWGSPSQHLGPMPKKADGVADAINRLLQSLCIRCAKEGGIRDYFHVGVIGYGEQVGPAFIGNLEGMELVPISKIGSNHARLEERTKKIPDGAGGVLETKVKFPIWFEAVASGGTPMSEAFDQAKSIVEEWIQNHPNGFPPMVINITDGEFSDGDPSDLANELKSLKTSDGNVLLMNLHLSSVITSPIVFPNYDAELPNDYSKILYNMSSDLTPFMVSVAKQHGNKVGDGAKGFAFNADLNIAIQFLDIGTRVSNYVVEK